ncbi:MAG: N-acetyl-gamma-glutamyl-phosphate reductase [Armatimonadetes bacterium]|nr:N-acetyl-gamma-glutamyl-phosphate reductase [Armatimonadota bacterium]
MANLIPVTVLGGSGYVAGECLRILLTHPVFKVVSITSSTQAGSLVSDAFPHLGPLAEDMKFCPADAEIKTKAVFCALPHGEAADILSKLGKAVKVVDLSADHRFQEGGPFFCGLPDIERETPTSGRIAHPGCFATCITLATAPLMALGLTEPEFFVSAVTGSTGSGRTAKPGTHHPERHGGIWAYEPLTHRHTPEVKMMLKRASGVEPKLAFVPHSGPFTRGIHATIYARLKGSPSKEEIIEQIGAYYARTPFVSVGAKMPNVKEAVGSNCCRIGVAVTDDQLILTSVIDNLIKGAAGGGIQWMNRLFGLDQSTGLLSPALGWN